MLRSRERREGTVGSGQCDVLPWSDGTEHAGEGAAGESEEMTMDGLATDGALHDPISLSTVLLFFFHLYSPHNHPYPCQWGHLHKRPTVQ